MSITTLRDVLAGIGPLPGTPHAPIPVPEYLPYIFILVESLADQWSEEIVFNVKLPAGSLASFPHESEEEVFIWPWAEILKSQEYLRTLTFKGADECVIIAGNGQIFFLLHKSQEVMLLDVETLKTTTLAKTLDEFLGLCTRDAQEDVGEDALEVMWFDSEDTDMSSGVRENTQVTGHTSIFEFVEEIDF